MTQPAWLRSGTVFFDRYQLVRCISAGGMGAVYECVDTKTRRRRALKVMLPGIATDADFRARFQREATVTASIESEHLVEIFDADVDAATGSPFLVMELLRGDDLGRVLAERGALPFDVAVGLLRQAARALDKTHAEGIVHRDLKPENLFVTRDEDGALKLKVLDFGIAKVVEVRSDAATTRALGTPLYMSPEQITGDGGIGPRADLFTLGHIAYALLTGEAYWAEEGAEASALFTLWSRMLLSVREPAGARAERRRGVALPFAFDAWFARATALDPWQRFEGAAAMIAELAAILAAAAEPRAYVDPAPRPSSLAADSSARTSGPRGTLLLDPNVDASGSGAAPAVSRTTSGNTGAARASSSTRAWLVAGAAIAAATYLGVSRLAPSGAPNAEAAIAATIVAPPLEDAFAEVTPEAADVARAPESAREPLAEAPREPPHGARDGHASPLDPPTPAARSPSPWDDAVGRGMTAARACVDGAATDTVVTLTFAPSGTLARVDASGWANDHGASACIERAFTGLAVAPFTAPSTSTRFVLRSRVR
ncbi:MAG TPA: protein kinase [Byssovorax sp.]|jgi:serine/threonine-protein kinase